MTDKIAKLSHMKVKFSGGSKGGARDVRPMGVQILSITCSIWENLAKSYVGTLAGGLVPPPRGNPGSATEIDSTRFN